ncbi:hypothetical protein pipiens_004645 [Culex pipiens pipiens]|uniref:Peptidase S1 domain-containing protein n=1 Tax=Culex pipiens pipiens TaxID=38569 RepID=A0ABD1CGK5_CULPP
MDPTSGSSPANGQPTRFREYAHMAALGWTEPDGSILWQCGGSLIWDNFVLTAAHCVLDARNRAPDVIRLGDLDLYSAEDDRYAQQFGIAQIIRHPEHKFAASYHDVALLKLDGKVTLDQTVLPACLWRDHEVRFKRLIATGWGNTGFVELTPIQTAQCSEWYPPSRKLRQGLQDQHLCAVDELMDTCEGDSGGPLQFKLMHNSRMTPFVIGVTSFGSVCGTSNPGVYTRVSSYHDWIVATMRNHGAVGLDEQLPHVIKSPVLSEDDCIISERYLPRFPHGLMREQVCVGNDVFLVPGACDLQIGGVLDISMYRGLSTYQTTVALSAVGRDCGFGEHIIATRLASHTEWMKSILLPKYRDTLSALRYNDSDLAEGDQCTCSDGRLGRCVAFGTEPYAC